MNTVTRVTSDNEIIDLSDDEIAAFVSGHDGEPAEETAARARRVLTQALCDPAVRERLLWLRSARADWEAEEARAQNAVPVETEARIAEADARSAEATRLTALQERLRAATLQSAGLDGAQEKSDAVSLWNVWKAGGGRWAMGAAESARGFVEAVQQAGRGARALTLGGQRTTLSLPCLAPAHAAPAEAPPEMHSDAITTADGVRITFQQSPNSWNRMRVLVDASHLTPAENGADREGRVAYNVAFLTLMEGDETESGAANHSRHLLVVALNERGKGYSDFSVTPGDGLASEADAQKVFPAPRAGGCRLVAATLSQMPPSLDVLDA